jgi:hypothetical protein
MGQQHSIHYLLRIIIISGVIFQFIQRGTNILQFITMTRGKKQLFLLPKEGNPNLSAKGCKTNSALTLWSFSAVQHTIPQITPH